jgi:hypothetical protein
MGCAPELDWLLDCCPVDFAASSVVNLSRIAKSNEVFHLLNPGGRYWHECLLWINLFGYPVRLLPFDAWISELKKGMQCPHHPLRELAPFFCRAVPAEPDTHLPQLYEETRRSSVSAAQSERALASEGLRCPRLNAQLFDRYFESLIASGFLPPLQSKRADRLSSPFQLDCGSLSSILERQVKTATRLDVGHVHSIVTELTSWRFKNNAGLFPCKLTMEDGEVLKVMVKLKPRDCEVLEVAESIAHLCSNRLGNAYTEFRNDMEFVRCDLRESAVYGQRDARFRNHAPVYHGSSKNTLIIEYLSDVVLKDSADDISGWSCQCIESAIEGAAALHSIWLGRTAELLENKTLGPAIVSTDTTKMTPFWHALADHALPFFTTWTGSNIENVQNYAIANLVEHNRIVSGLPATLIHNDFNPRNIALRNSAGRLRLCAYDWEMAKIGLPQHDLAEFLCFVLTCEVSKAEVLALIELHRSTLEKKCGVSLDRDAWLIGFRLSLLDLLINRFAMYVMVHRFRKQAFLKRVMKSWYRLYEMLR